MSDSHNTGHGGHGHDSGGHEMDVPPTKELFNIVWGLGALTLLSLITCVQLFNGQQRDIMDERAKESSYVLESYRKDMDAVTKGSGEASFKDSNGVEIKQRFVPLAVARELVISKPERLQAAPAPKGWQHPDDIAAGGAAAGGAPPTGATVIPTGANDATGTPAGTVGQPGVPVLPSDAGAAAAVPNVDAAAGNTPGQPGAAAADPQAAAPSPGTQPAPGTGVAAPTEEPPAGKAPPAKSDAAGKASADVGKSPAGKAQPAQPAP